MGELAAALSEWGDRGGEGVRGLEASLDALFGPWRGWHFSGFGF
jgi:hypothetical protein